MNALEIRKIRKEMGLTQREFAEKLSVSERTVQSWEAGGAIPETKHAVLRSITQNKIEEPAGTLNDRNALKYYYDMDVTASNIGDASDNEQHAPFRLINLPGFEGCVGFNVVGESMLPTARPRDIAAIDPRPVEIIANGEVYLLVTRDGQRMVKRLMRTPDGVRCISDNTAVEWYAPFDVDAAMIVNAYRVRGFISITNLV